MISIHRPINITFTRRFYSLFNLDKIISEDESTKTPVTVSSVPEERWPEVVNLVKKEYYPHHALVRARDFSNLGRNIALDEYIIGLLRQGNSLYATTAEGKLAGACVSIAATRSDPKALEQFASCRQDKELKELLYFTAKLQETPNLWEMFGQQKVFEMRMLAVVPEKRRYGVGSALSQRAIALARHQGYSVVRMDCFQHIGCKLAERCEMRCLHKLRLSELTGQDGRPFLPAGHRGDRTLRVYADRTPSGKARDWLKSWLGRSSNHH